MACMLPPDVGQLSCCGALAGHEMMAPPPSGGRTGAVCEHPWLQLTFAGNDAVHAPVASVT
jgi:hypothetical protein